MPEAVGWIETGTVYELMQRVEVGAVASGTATLEAACLGLPYAVVYQVNWLTYVVGKSVVKIKHLGMVNILAGREVVRELVQQALTADSLAAEMQRLAGDAAARQRLLTDLEEVVASLGQPGAYRHAAELMAQELA
jgi:lipid-A-disaccharide synthase